ncbi:hypothetical protein Ancab_001082 [Ancistrocladus abbreviatus]
MAMVAFAPKVAVGVWQGQRFGASPSLRSRNVSRRSLISASLVTSKPVQHVRKFWAPGSP